MVMKRSALRVLLLAVLGVFALSCAGVAAGQTPDDLLERRNARLYVEGQVLGDMVLGARARLDFIYVDRALAEAVKDGTGAPEWLRWNVGYYGSEKVGKDALFLLDLETFKPWTFEPEMISVNGRPLERNDILTRPEYFPEGDLPSGFRGNFAFKVPMDLVEPGREIAFSCGEYSKAWRVPER